MPAKLYVGGLSFSTTSDGLGAHFKQCGNVVSATVVTERDTEQSRGFGFVEMATQAEADNAIVTLDKKPLDGRDLTVNMARPRAERSLRG
jgi:RNA recognition motif-containing protein